MHQVMSGEATPAQIAGFAMALRAKGETADEVDGLVRAMLEHALKVTVEGRAVDTCGTGGGRAHTGNISTMAGRGGGGGGGAGGKHGQRAPVAAGGGAGASL